MTSYAQRRRRGFATVAVVVLMVMMAAAMTAQSMLFVAQAKRTHAAVDGMQVRQLLLAGDAAARAELAAHGTTPRAVSVAVPGDAGTLTLTVAPLAGEQARVSAAAAFHGQRGRQELTFVKRGDVWELVKTELAASP